MAIRRSAEEICSGGYNASDYKGGKEAQLQRERQEEKKRRWGTVKAGIKMNMITKGNQSTVDAGLSQGFRYPRLSSKLDSPGPLSLSLIARFR